MSQGGDIISQGLSPEEVQRFERDGFIGPFTLMRRDQMDIVRSDIERSVASSEGPYKRDRWESRHQDCRCVYDLCTHHNLIHRIATLLGQDLVLWNSVFFNKGPGGREVPWHQDRDFLLLTPNINVAAWLAIDDATLDNGCLEFIPGSHFMNVPHLPRVRGNQFEARADLRYVDRSRKVALQMDAGQFAIFHRDVLHHSAANLSLKRRLGLVIRFTVPGVHVDTAGLFERHLVYRVLGQSGEIPNVVGEAPHY